MFRYRIYDEDVISEASHCSQMSTQHHNGSVAGTDHPMSPPNRPLYHRHNHHGHVVHNPAVGNGTVNVGPPHTNGTVQLAHKHTQE